MSEVEFRSVPSERIVGLLLSEGCVLLRGFADTAALATLRGLVEDMYAGVDGVHVYARDLRARGLPPFHEPIFTAPHQRLLATLFGAYGYSVSEETVTRSVDPQRRHGRWVPPLATHLDAFSHAPEFTVNFWVPLRECGGGTAPSLGVVRAPFAETLAFTGYDAGRLPAPGGRRRYLPQFDPAMSDLFSHDTAAAARFRDHFGARIWTPEYRLGDAMMLTNWTLHFTHATAGMTTRRTNLELRFSGPASLTQILAAHQVATA